MGGGFAVGGEEGARSTIIAAPFRIEAVIGKEHSATVTVQKFLAPGAGLLLVVGRVNRPDVPQFQETIVEILSTKASQTATPPI
jgi:hypothetical protein